MDDFLCSSLFPCWGRGLGAYLGSDDDDGGLALRDSGPSIANRAG